MTEEQLQELKNQLRNEILNELGNRKNYSTWYKYSKEYIEPNLKRIFKDETRRTYRVKTGLNNIASALVRKDATSQIDDTDLGKIKPIIEYLISKLGKEE